MASGWKIPQRTFDFLILPSTVALILAIVGGSNQFSSSGSQSNSSQNLTHAAIVIFIVMFVVQSIITIFTFRNLQVVSQGDKRILIAVALSIPFLLVRLIYSLLATFDTSSSTFSLTAGSVIVEGFMSVLEEFVVVILYLAAGATAPKLAKGNLQQEQWSEPSGTVPRYQEVGVES